MNMVINVSAIASLFLVATVMTSSAIASLFLVATVPLAMTVHKGTYIKSHILFIVHLNAVFY